MDSRPDTSPRAAEAAEIPRSPEDDPAGKAAWRERLKGLIAESGKIVIWVYFGIFGLVLVSSAMALKMGVQLNGVAGEAGTWVAAYLFTKLTQPLRIAATLAITPAIATFLRRFRRPEPVPVLVESSAEVSPSTAGRQSEQ